MPLTRAQAAQGETSENAEEQDNKGSECERHIRSEFEAELLAAVQEQRDLLKEYKERQDGKVLEVVDIFSNTMQNLSNEFAQVCDKNKRLEIVVFQLRDRVEALESEIKISEERLEKINAGVFASLHHMIKSELREEFKSILSARVKTEETANEGLSTMLSEARPSGGPPRRTLSMSKPYRQFDKKKQPAECNVLSARGTDNSACRPVQKPAVFDRRSSWEAYMTQFKIVAEINQCDGPDKAAFLATSLRGPALTVLSNLPSES